MRMAGTWVCVGRMAAAVWSQIHEVWKHGIHRVAELEGGIDGSGHSIRIDQRV